MSFCYFSSNAHRCDLYCYADSHGGYTTHVANGRAIGDIPDDRAKDYVAGTISAEEFCTLRAAQRTALRAAKFVPIGVPCDGKTFHDATVEAFLLRLVALRAAGYEFPDRVFDAIANEVGLAETGTDASMEAA